MKSAKNEKSEVEVIRFLLKMTKCQLGPIVKKIVITNYQIRLVIIW